MSDKNGVLSVIFSYVGNILLNIFLTILFFKIGKQCGPYWFFSISIFDILVNDFNAPVSLHNLVLDLLNVFIIGLFFLLSYIKKDVIGEIHYTFGAFLPILSMVFAFLAAHFIKKDEQLVRNSDRIR